ncbi:MAG TPA: extracellular solute-binding protein [Bacillota bacterium]|nr:extracellular solute-binding protein [Bacillota bacterium]
MVKKKMLLIAGLVLLILAGTFTAWKLFYHRPEELLSQLEEGEVSEEHLTEATLTFLLGGSAPQAPQEVLDQVERKLKNSLNIKFKILLGDASSEDMAYWDVLYYHNFHSDFKTLVNQGLKDITEEFQRLAPNYYRRLSPEELKTVTQEGKIYAIPQHFFTPQMCCAIVREDLMNKYQIPEINDFDDFENYLKTVKAKEPRLFPVIFSDNSVGLFAEANGYVILNNQLGLVYRWDDPEPKIEAWEQTQAFRQGIDILSRWYNNRYLFGPATEIDDKMVGSGKWASFIAPLGSEISYNAILKSQNIRFRYKAYPLNSGHSSARNPSTSMLLINPQSKNTERIFRFINWLYSKQENYDSLMYGVKGKHYRLEGERIKFASSDPYTWIWHDALRNIDFERYEFSSSADSQKEYREMLENNTKFPPYTGFIPDFGPVQRTATLRQVSLGSIETSIYHGTFSPADVDKYIREQKQAGVDQLVVEVKRQLERWKAQK